MNAPEKVIEQVVVRFEEWMLPELLLIVRAHYDESPVMQVFPYDEERVKEVLVAGVIDPRLLAVACINMETRKIEGVIMASIASLYYTAEPIVDDIIMFVLPECRGTGVAPKLLEAYARWGKRMGVRNLFFTQTSGVDVKGTEEKFRGMGWNYIGSKMMLQLPEPDEKKETKTEVTDV